MKNKDISFDLKRVPLDGDYCPSDKTRLTTNFANLARGETRKENLCNVLKMIDNRFNSLAYWDNEKGDRYSIELEVISIEVKLNSNEHNETFAIIEILNTTIIDKKLEIRVKGITGNNFSSYVRDYDFSVLLAEYNKNKSHFSIPPDFGNLHGKLFKYFTSSDIYKKNFQKPPVICLSVSENRTYRRTDTQHPVLGVEYQQRECSLTDQYFEKMGLKARYFMPCNSVAPLAFYFSGDLLADYTNLELISATSTMESFQKIYRPEIYNANSAAAAYYQPSLNQKDYSLTRIVYDREERSQLAVAQGHYTDERFIKPYRRFLEQWLADHSI